MSYEPRYRKRVLEYRATGHTLQETFSTFKVSISTIRAWERQYREEGHLENKPLNRSHKKIDPKKLETYVIANPDAYQSEMAEAFECSPTAIRKALTKLGITRKKRQRDIGSKSQSK